MEKSYAKRNQLKEKKKAAALHEYKPEDYGLTRDGIHQEFAEYIKKYNLLE